MIPSYIILLKIHLIDPHAYNLEIAYFELLKNGPFAITFKKRFSLFHTILPTIVVAQGGV